MIPGGAKLTLGATINLGNYENLKIEVEGDCRTVEDIDEVRAMLVAEIKKSGRDDPEMAGRCDAYCNRVFGGGPVEALKPLAAAKAAETAPPTIAEPEKPARPLPAATVEPIDPDADSVTIDGKVYPRKKAAAAAPVKAEATPEPVAAPEPKAAPKKAPTPAADSPFTCEDCGCGVTAGQQKASRLFISKTLCKECIQKRNRAEA
jgi:hypothetical protein